MFITLEAFGTGELGVAFMEAAVAHMDDCSLFDVAGWFAF
jgi:hypothetical protein